MSEQVTQEEKDAIAGGFGDGEEFEQACTQCPHVVGDAYQRDCAYPDCMRPRQTVVVPLAALQEVIRISDREHVAWDTIKAVIAASPTVPKQGDFASEDAERFRYMAAAFDQLSTSRARNVLTNFGFEDSTPWVNLAHIVDAEMLAAKETTN